MADPPKAAVDLIRVIHHLAGRHLADAGGGDPIVKAARAVIWARYYRGDDAWDRMKEVIGALEDLVGRPESEEEI